MSPHGIPQLLAYEESRAHQRLRPIQRLKNGFPMLWISPLTPRTAKAHGLGVQMQGRVLTGALAYLHPLLRLSLQLRPDHLAGGFDRKGESSK